MGTLRRTLALLLYGALLPGSAWARAQDISSECSTLVPIEIGDKSHALVRFQIGDEEVLLFLDTGNATAGIDLNAKALERVSVSFTGTTRRIQDWQAQTYEERAYTIPEVRLGNLLLRDVVGHVTRHSIAGSDGTFALAPFVGCNALIDLPGRRFGLFPTGSVPGFVLKDEWIEVPFVLSGDGGVELRLTLEGAEGPFVFGLDNATIAIDEAGQYLNTIRAGSRLGQHLLAHDRLTEPGEPAALGAFSTDRLLAHGTPLGRLDFLVLDYPLPEIDGLLGAAFFREFSLFVDFSRNELYLRQARE